VDGTRDQLLAGAARSLYQNGALASRDIRHDAEDLLKRIALADDVFEGVLVIDLPTQLLDGGKNTALLTLTGTARERRVSMRAGRSTTSRPVSIVSRIGQACSHRSAWKTSEHRLPKAISFGTPVIRSAARLNEVMRQLQSTVNTPSATQPNTAWKN
jgi:hypothetical protein